MIPSFRLIARCFKKNTAFLEPFSPSITYLGIKTNEKIQFSNKDTLKMFEGMTDKGRYNREAPARIFHSSAGSNPNFQRKPHVEKPYKSKPKRQTPLNHLPKEFHGRPFSRNLYLTSRSQIFEKKKERNLYLKRLERRL